MTPEQEISRVKNAKGYYEELGVSRSATEKEIKKAYRKVKRVFFFSNPTLDSYDLFLAAGAKVASRQVFTRWI